MKSVLLALWLVSSTSVALSIDNLPFIESRPASLIQLNKPDDALQDVLVNELKIQRNTNRQLQLYQTNNKIALYEKELLIKRLRAEGFYSAQIRTTVAETIEHQVNAGPVYTIADIKWRMGETIAPPSNVKLHIGDPLIAEQVLQLRAETENYIISNYCLYHVTIEHEVKILHENASAEITYILEPSPETTFGNITVSGTDRVEPSYIQEQINIESDSCFSRHALDKARLSLLKTNLLASVDVAVGPVSKSGVPVTFTVKERHQKSVSAGLGYSSEFGMGIITGWEHRNLMGRSEHASVQLYLAEKRQTVDANLVIPDFYRSNQILNLFSQLDQQDTDAYESKTASVGASLSRMFGHHLRADLGAQIDFSQIIEDDEEEDYALISVPANLEYDRRNDLLDPRKGWSLSLSAQPFWNLYETSDKFLKNSMAASFYYTFEPLAFSPTIALRAALGSINGIDREDVPATYRFYVGGGGSVRGYPYQTLGVLTDDEPDGGLSYNEYSIESRLHFGSSWGLVFFLDGGYAYENEVPSVGEDLLWGAGLGLRYYTSFAPIRFDIGFPLDKRDGTDDSFQIYISIGQAF